MKSNILSIGRGNGPTPKRGGIDGFVSSKRNTIRTCSCKNRFTSVRKLASLRGNVANSMFPTSRVVGILRVQYLRIVESTIINDRSDILDRTTSHRRNEEKIFEHVIDKVYFLIDLSVGHAISDWLVRIRVAYATRINRWRFIKHHLSTFLNSHTTIIA